MGDPRNGDAYLRTAGIARISGRLSTSGSVSDWSRSLALGPKRKKASCCACLQKVMSGVLRYPLRDLLACTESAALSSTTNTTRGQTNRFAARIARGRSARHKTHSQPKTSELLKQELLCVQEENDLHHDKFLFHCVGENSGY